MTGRRLYELLCDAHAARGSSYDRTNSYNRLGLADELVAWPFLARGEKQMLNQVAARLSGVKRR
jgi:hypothetical protein